MRFCHEQPLQRQTVGVAEHVELAGDEGGGDEGRGGVEGEVEGRLLVEGLHRGRRSEEHTSELQSR